ncbi:signal transduction histidine kinase (plasmid) [Hoeflea sp. IMCC20628]|uniref:ATP-binding protein n=1 Tax=Hoeflea sp. IMCC20628 TaxID=1620421 RepID=UPI00063AEEAE|nr:ATP-binding protein [Hoeflea sp. IMCC20628]AKI03311.1 signal transduction histidine kinase [Hoeflea sp. IMCC20628]
MRVPRSLQARLAILIGLGVTVLWIIAATVTATLLSKEMDEVFDSALQETAQRLLPLAVVDIIDREEEGVSQRIANLREHSEFLTYIVRDAQGRVLISSHAADPSVFPPYDGVGFRQSATHRLYYDSALQDSITIAVAEPLDHRALMAREMQLGLGLPLLAVIPLCLVAIFGAVGFSFRPVRQLRNALASRGAHDLSPTSNLDLPSELAPIAVATNELLARLNAAFEAERSFAANAAHELRTPVAGAIAQAQRLQSETSDPVAANRAADIETTLKRLMRLSEKLIQLARAEGGRLRTGKPQDLRTVLRLIVSDFERTPWGSQIDFISPEHPVMSDIDPDAFGIVCRNLIENALKHGSPGSLVKIRLSAPGKLSIENDGPVIKPEILARLTRRFERGSGSGEGSGLGLAIVHTIADRADCTFKLTSPIVGQTRGIEAAVVLPTVSLQVAG